jgi:hypothetical protein
MLRWLKRAFTQNLLLKFTALVCAVVLWVYVDFFVPVERTIEAEVRPDQIPGWLADLPSEPFPIRVTVRGPSRKVRLLTGDDIALHPSSHRSLCIERAQDLVVIRVEPPWFDRVRRRLQRPEEGAVTSEPP